MGRDGKVQNIQIGLVPAIAQAPEPLGQGFLQCPEFLLALRQIVDGTIEAGAAAAYLLDPGRDFQQAFLGSDCGNGFLRQIELLDGLIKVVPRLASTLLNAFQPGDGVIRETFVPGQGLQLGFAAGQFNPVPPVPLSGC